MKILILSRSFYPENNPRANRTTELVREFVRQGHDVTLYTFKNADIHPEFEKKYGVAIIDIGKLKFRTVDISRGSKNIVMVKRFIRRTLLQLFEYPNIEIMFKVKSALKKISGFDLLISIAVPHPVHWGVAWAWNNKHPIAKTWVADCGDPYMGEGSDTFRKFFYFKYLERWFSKKADYLTVPFKGAIDAYYPEFRNKIKVIPQGFNFDEVGIDKLQYKPNIVPTFAYAGGLIPGHRNPKELLEFLLSLDLDYKFLIYTKSTSFVKPYALKSNGRIEIRDFAPRKEVLKVLSTMDFLLNFNNKTEVQLPSKLIDYYIAGRPVLSITPGRLNKNIILEFLSGNYLSEHKYENVEQYKISNVCKEFLVLTNK